MGCRKLPYTPLHPSFSFPEHYQRNPAGTCFPAGLFVVIGIYCSLYGTSQRSNPFRFLHVNRSFLKLNRISFARSHTILNWRFPSESTSNSPYPHVSLPKIPSANESAVMLTPRHRQQVKPDDVLAVRQFQLAGIRDLLRNNVLL